LDWTEFFEIISDEKGHGVGCTDLLVRKQIHSGRARSEADKPVVQFDGCKFSTAYFLLPGLLARIGSWIYGERIGYRAGCESPLWVKMRQTPIEHVFSALPPIADIAQYSRYVWYMPIGDIERSLELKEAAN
jgi:hypothetical protein